MKENSIIIFGVHLINKVEKQKYYLFASTRHFEFIELSLKAYVRVGCISCTSDYLKGLLVIYVCYRHNIGGSDCYRP